MAEEYGDVGEWGEEQVLSLGLWLRAMEQPQPSRLTSWVAQDLTGRQKDVDEALQRQQQELQGCQQVPSSFQHPVFVI